MNVEVQAMIKMKAKIKVISPEYFAFKERFWHRRSDVHDRGSMFTE